MPPATIDEALSLIKRDPVAGFVAIPILAQRGGAPPIIAFVRGRRISLPAWTGNDWNWYGALAFDIARRLQPTGLDAFEALFDDRATRKVSRAAKKLRDLGEPMQRIGKDIALEIMAGVYYQAAVGLVLHAVAAASGPTVGDRAVDAIKEALRDAPDNVRKGLAAVAGAGGDAVAEVGKQAGKVVKAIFGGLGVAALVLLALWYYSRRRE